MIGGVGGILYSVVDAELLKAAFGIVTPTSVIVAHDIVDFLIPALLGILIGLAFNVLKKQKLMNQKLSIKNAKLQRDLLINTLTSLFLHEIRNPIHNITAALEDSRVVLPQEIGEMISRNLKRLNDSTAQYRKWGSLFEKIDPKEKTELKPWLDDFIVNKVRARLRELNIEYVQEADPVYVYAHPVLLDQSFTTLFSNASEALSKESGPRHLRLVCRLEAAHEDKHAPRKVEIKLINKGSGFKQEVLEKQAQSPIESKTGLGVGLTLLRRVLEQIEGEIHLSNFVGHAEVRMTIPGESA